MIVRVGVVLKRTVVVTPTWMITQYQLLILLGSNHLPILFLFCVGKRGNGGNGLTILLFTPCRRISTAQHRKLCRLLSTLPRKATLVLLRNTQLTLLGHSSCTLLENMSRTSKSFFTLFELQFSFNLTY